MKRVVVNVSTGRYVAGQARLTEALALLGEDYMLWRDELPPGSPSHQETPYAFKSWALEAARQSGHTLLLWADASIIPIASLELIWAYAEAHGVWLSDNGYRNDEWTCEAAYPLLGVTKEENHNIKHVVATAFAVDLLHPVGAQFFVEYFRLAKNGAFKGPWKGGVGVQHRHDQTCASVIAHRLRIPLTNPPRFFAYDGGQTEETILIAKGV
jgi:hypothetical protein